MMSPLAFFGVSTILSSRNSSMLNEKIKAEAYDLGFVAVGFCSPDVDIGYAHYVSWVEDGRHAGMAYLERPTLLEKRKSADAILPGCKTVISLAYPYAVPDQQPKSRQGRIAAYALSQDYHIIVSQKATLLSEKVESLSGVRVNTHVCVDTAPILEKGYAQQAGLGWIGRNSLLLHPQYGSYLFLAEVLVDLRLETDLPFEQDGCGSCQRCVQACPTQAIMPDRSIDARRCLSYLTIENRGEIPLKFREALGNRVFGCDTCQSVCPHNVRLPEFPAGKYPEPMVNSHPDLAENLLIQPDVFPGIYGKTPVARAKHQGFRRNVAIAVGNTGMEEFIPLLGQTLERESDPVVAEATRWAIERLTRSGTKR